MNFLSCNRSVSKIFDNTNREENNKKKYFYSWISNCIKKAQKYYI